VVAAPALVDTAANAAPESKMLKAEAAFRLNLALTSSS
jgi:hypothetical protein